MQGFMNLRELYIGNMERVQDLLQVGRLVTNKRGGHGLSLVSLETLHLRLLPDMRCIELKSVDHVEDCADHVEDCAATKNQAKPQQAEKT
jgi:hypothetical protein